MVIIPLSIDGLHGMGMVQKLGNWIPQELTKDKWNIKTSLVKCLLKGNKERIFCIDFVTGDEK